MKTPFFIVLLLSVVATSCSVGPVYTPPITAVPEDWKGKSGSQSPESLPDNWWEIFNDPALNELEQCALKESPHLKKAVATVLEARAQVMASRAPLFPQLSQDLSVQQSEELFEIFFGSGMTFQRVNLEQFSFPLNLSYEVDLWGKLAHGYTAAVDRYESSEKALATVWLTLTSDVARYYFQVRSLDAELAVLDKMLVLLFDAWEINKGRFEGGLANALDVRRAEIEWATTKADHGEVMRQRIAAENALAIATGISPSAFCWPKNPLEETPPPPIPLGLPYELLCRRPDIAEAERLIAASSEEIGVAIAEYFPSLSLTAGIGFLSPEISEFFAWRSRYWSYTASLSQAIFTGGKITADVEAARARYWQQMANYEQVVLVAFGEVEDALAGLRYYEEQQKYQQQADVAAEDATLISQRRYDIGLSTYLDVVASQRSWLDAQRQVVKTEYLQYASTIQLVKALGGAWKK